MVWDCRVCHHRHEGEASGNWQFCPNCGQRRDLTKRTRGAPLRVLPAVAVRSRSGGPDHVLLVTPDRVATCGCKAAQYGRVCHAARDLEARLLAFKDREVHAVLDTHARVRTILSLYPETRVNDWVLFTRYFEHWHGLDPEAIRPLFEILATEYKGNHFERIRRVRAHVQNVEHEFEPDSETRHYRQANREAMHGLFATQESMET